MAKWFSWLEEKLGGAGNQKVRTFRLLMLVGLVGVMLMVMNAFLQNVHIKDVDPINQGRASPGDEPSQAAFVGGGSKEKSSFRDYEQAYEQQLRDILTKIVGVGEVEVLVTIDSTEEISVPKNTKSTSSTTTEKDTNGATRNVTEVTESGEVVLYQVSGGQQPLIVKTIKPKIRGVLVVAKGSENLTVKKLLVEAIERGLDVPSHRISVVPRKTG